MFVGLGWTFGAVEAISLILFVGFSVDYTLHVAEAFHMAPARENGMNKVHEAHRRIDNIVTRTVVEQCTFDFSILLGTVFEQNLSPCQKGVVHYISLPKYAS